MARKVIAIIALVCACRSGGDDSSGDSADKPATPQVIGPVSGAHTGSVRAGDLDAARPRFHWRAPATSTALGYQLQVDDSCEPGALQACPFASPEIDVTDLQALEYRPPKPLPTSAQLPLGRRYFWRLRACAGEACSPWTRVRYVEVARTRGDLNGDGYSDVAIGAPLVDNGGSDQGSVFVYYGTARGIGLSERLDDPSAADGSNFGVAVTMAGDIDGDGFGDLLVGAAGTDRARGNAWIFYGSATGVHRQRKTKLARPDGAEDDWFGAAVAAAGDVDGDGFGDILIGASGVSREGPGWGVAYLYGGSAEGVRRSEPLVLGVPSSRDFDHFGYAVAGVGDVNGDGYADVAIGSPGIDIAGGRGGTDRGAVYVFHGGSDGVLRVPSARLEAPRPLDHDRFGFALAGAGDVDGDGHADLIVGAPGSDVELDDGGSAYVFRGGPRGVASQPTAVLRDLRVTGFDRFGTSVACAGDVNRDGFDDVVVGTSGARRGRAVLFHGTREGTSTRASGILLDPLGDGYNDFAETVGGAGDLNGDGFDDLIIGASGSDNGGVFRGSVVLYPGTAHGIDPDRPLRIDDPASGEHDHFGRSVAGR